MSSFIVSDIRSPLLYSKESFTQRLSVCSEHQDSICSALTHDFKSLVSTALFQECFSRFLSENEKNPISIKIYVSQHAITVKTSIITQTVDLDAIEDLEEQDIDEAKGIVEKIIRKANRTYQNCHFEDRHNPVHPPYSRSRVAASSSCRPLRYSKKNAAIRALSSRLRLLKAKATTLQSKAQNHPQLAEKLSHLEEQLKKIEGKLDLYSVSPAPLPEDRLNALFSRLDAIEQKIATQAPQPAPFNAQFLSAFQTQIDNKTAENAVLREQLQVASETAEQRKAAINALKNNIHNKAVEIVNLKEQLQATSETAEQHKVAVETLHNGIQNKTAEMTKLQEQLKSTTESAEQQKVTIDTLSNTIHTKTAEIDNLKEQLQATSETAEQHKAAVETLNEGIQSKTAEITKLQEQVQATSATTATIDTLSRIILDKSAEISQLHAQLGKIENQLKVSSQQIEEKDKALNELKEKLSEEVKLTGNLTDELSEMNLQNSIANADSRITQEYLEEKIARLEEDVQELTQALKRLYHELQETRRKTAEVVTTSTDEEIRRSPEPLSTPSPTPSPEKHSTEAQNMEKALSCAGERAEHLANALRSFGGIDFFTQDSSKLKIFNVNHALLDIEKISFDPNSGHLKVQLSSAAAQAFLLSKNLVISSVSPHSTNPLESQLLKLRGAIAIKAGSKKTLRTIESYFHPLNVFCEKFNKLSIVFTEKINAFYAEYVRLGQLHQELQGAQLLSLIKQTKNSGLPDSENARRMYADLRTFCQNEFIPLFEIMPAKLIITTEVLAKLHQQQHQGVETKTYPVNLMKMRDNFKCVFLNLLKIIAG